MSKEAKLVNLHSTLQQEIQQNDASDDPTAFLNTLIYNKHDKVS